MHTVFSSNLPPHVLQQLTGAIAAFRQGQCAKIGEGKYREAFAFGDDICIKKLKPARSKSVLGLEIVLPAKLYQFLTMSHADLNRYELMQRMHLQQRIAPHVQENFSDIYAAAFDTNQSFSLGQLVRNYDGTISTTLQEHGTIDGDSTFWDEFIMVRDELLAQQVPYFDIQPSNILVQVTKSSGLRPVFFDFKRIDAQRYSFQPWNLSTAAQMAKLERQFDRVAAQYCQ